MDLFLDQQTYHLRITTILEMDIIKKFITSFDYIKKYLITHEVTHYHCLLITPEDIVKRRSEFREKIKENLKVIGNAGYYLAKINSRKGLMKYILKDDEHYESNLSEEIISRMKKCSFKKSSNGAFTKALADLEESFLCDNMDQYSFMVQVVKLKSDYNHSISRHAMQSYINRMNAKRSNSWIENFVSNLDLF